MVTKKPSSKTKPSYKRKSSLSYYQWSRYSNRAKALIFVILFAIAGVTALLLSRAAAPSYTLFGTDTPKNVTASDHKAVELGVKFQANTDGAVSAIRFYKGSTNTGTHTGSLWTSTGTQLATATFTSETASGWQQVNFATPVAIKAGTVYVASYHTNVGHYAYDYNYFTNNKTHVSGALTALGDSPANPNGVYLYGPGGFPSQSSKATNYWVDVIYSQLPTAPTNLSAVVSPTLTATTTKSVTLKWTASTDYLPIVSYTIYRNNVKLGTTVNTSYVDPNLPVGAYAYTVTATDSANNTSLVSNTATATISPPPTPTSSPTPTPVSGGGGSCPTGWPAGAPCVATTGVPAGTTLTPSGSLTITTNGTVINGLDVTGTITVKANNVTIKNTKVHLPSPGVPTCGTYIAGNGSATNATITCPKNGYGGMIEIDSYGGSSTSDPYKGLVVSHVELDCGGRTTQAGPSIFQINLPYAVQEGILYGQWTGDHLNIHGCGNDVLMRSNTHLSDSYIWGLSMNSACFLPGAFGDNSVCDHLDGIEISNGSINTDGATTTDVTNNFIFGAWNSCTWLQATQAGQFLRNLTYDHNWCAITGSYYAYKDDPVRANYQNIVYRNNRAVRYPQNANGGNPDASWLSLGGVGVSECGTVFDDNNTLVANSTACR